MAVRALQPLKVSSRSSGGVVDRQVTVVREVQFSNALCSIVDTPSGRVMDSKEEQWLNAACPMYVTPFGISTETKAEQCEKVLCVMLVSFSGRVMVVREVQ